MIPLVAHPTAPRAMILTNLILDNVRKLPYKFKISGSVVLV
jgi:hypothetical protein